MVIEDIFRSRIIVMHCQIEQLRDYFFLQKFLLKFLIFMELVQEANKNIRIYLKIKS